MGITPIEKYAPHDKEIKQIIEDYFLFLFSNDCIFFTDFPSLFPRICLDWDLPAKVTNAIIDISDPTVLDIRSLFSQLNKLGCTSIQIRCYSYLTLNDIENMMNLLVDSMIDSIEFIIPLMDNMHLDNWSKLVQQHVRIKFIQLYGADRYETIVEGKESRGSIHLIKDTLISERCCGLISYFYFAPNRSTITESHHHNSCLNRKISIDTEGNIKNCPSMSQSFGNIKDTTLQEALDHPDFKKYWNVTKDQISVCKDCEFRYICTDCRGYIENPEDMYSKPLKCGYNPYTCEWEEWSTNPLKQKAIDYYGMREVLPEFKMKPDYVPSINPDPA